MTALNGLENGDGSNLGEAKAKHLESRRNEQGKRSEAECKQPLNNNSGWINGTHGGGAGGSAPAILDKLPITARNTEKHLEDKRWWELTQEDKQRKKFNRAFQRFMLGRGFEGQYMLLTLTTPENFKGDIHQAWRKWLMRMRRKKLVREYFAVKEWNERHTCIHLHVVLRLDYLGYQIAREQWKTVTGAVWIHVDKIYSIKGMANYLAKYILKGYNDMPGKRGYWYSYEWIHRKWHAFNDAMYKYGEIVSNVESELIHGLKELPEKFDYMNWRMQSACLHAIRNKIIFGELELIQF